jgi:hypothetical protein
MTKRLLELSASILCVALTLGVIFACIQLKHGTDAGIATNNEIRTAVHSLNEIATLQVVQSKRQADATDAASEIGFLLVARGLEAVGVMPSSEASAYVDASLEKLSRISERTGHIAKLLNSKGGELGALAPRLPGIPQFPTSIADVADNGERTLATQVLEDLRLVDAAIDQWSIENNKPTGTPVRPQDIAQYFKPNSPLQRSSANGRCLDALGNPITIKAVDTPPSISRQTFERLSPVAPREFWEPFSVSAD